MKAQEKLVLNSYTTVINGQKCIVQRLAPTLADAIEQDTSRLSFHKRSRNCINNRKIAEWPSRMRVK